jgi:transposase
MSDETTEVKRRRANYSQQFKIDAVKQVLEGGRTEKEVALSLGISPGTLRVWKMRYGQENSIGSRAFPGKGYLTPQDEELRRLKRQLQQAEQERDILKKALAFFSRTEK